MPIHDWSRVDPGLFHHFRHAWTCVLVDRLNSGQLPSGRYALLEAPEKPTSDIDSDAARYAAKGDRIAIHAASGHVVSVIDLVSPGNKHTRTAVRAFVERSVETLKLGIHLLIIDLFPPSGRDPEGIHKAIWGEISDEPFTLPADRPLTLAAYAAGTTMTACVEPVAVGQAFPEIPLFLGGSEWIAIPLEETYETTWSVCPEPLRDAVSGGEP